MKTCSMFWGLTAEETDYSIALEDDELKRRVMYEVKIRGLDTMTGSGVERCQEPDKLSFKGSTRLKEPIINKSSLSRHNKQSKLQKLEKLLFSSPPLTHRFNGIVFRVSLLMFPHHISPKNFNLLKQT
ncbi:hypothetical protein QVD17_09525 [Tagetes erecta]|uniref:Uncharacterized protein n=1 Tax=Tagetes erecta TaxID=13708 RepID=A0AAD8L658_TARER|nr:hypothetical protein QVD17_09525 [Tagetes erecta]